MGGGSSERSQSRHRRPFQPEFLFLPSCAASGIPSGGFSSLRFSVSNATSASDTGAGSFSEVERSRGRKTESTADLEERRPSAIENPF